jgi:iron(III) transport system ATP-binding protein
VREDIRDLQQNLNLTVAYVTHDQEEALAVSDRIIVMSNARIAQSGTPRELYEAPADLFVADFIGDANILEATIVEERGERALVRLGTLTVDLPRRNMKPGPARLAVRPDAFLLRTDAAAPGLSAQVTKASYLGGHVEYEVDSPVGSLFVVEHGRAEPLAPGTSISITLADRGVSIVPG